jgi:predicted dehydrogenase
MKDESSFSRRGFLAGSAAAAGALGMTAKSYAATKGANDRLRFAFIGCGGIASHHRDKLLPILEEENAEIVAVCDVYGRRSGEFQRKIGKVQATPDEYADYRKVLDREDVDYVLIATPEHSHAYITLDALDAGKHVYVEKPMTHTIEESQAVVKKVNETGLKLQVGVQGTADDSYSSAYEAIKAGKLGTVVQAQIDYVRDYGLDKGPWRKGAEGEKPLPDDLDWKAWQKPAPEHAWAPERYYEWRCYRDYSGGVATDLFIHRLTRLIKACGLTYPERVIGMGGIYTWNDGRDLPDSFEMLCEYGAQEGVTNGMTVHVLGTMANDMGNDHCIRGTKATLYFRGPGWEIVDDESGEVIETHQKTGGEDVDPHHRNHHAAIREGVALNCPAEIGLYGVVACRMANLSWFEKNAYVWDGATETARPA